MFNADPHLVELLSPHLERVLVIDPFEASANAAGELLRGLGAWRVEVVETSRKGYDLAQSWSPHFILSEAKAPGVDGALFTRAIRRSNFSCRQAPIVVASAQTKASDITAARDAGAHEFLRKPFSANDLKRRIENVALKPRPWIEAVGYVGPDRRRFNSGGYGGAKRRDADRKAGGAQSETERFLQALAILSSAVKQYDSDPAQATRAMHAQIETLGALAGALRQPRLVYSVAALDRYLATASQSGSRRLIQALLEEGANPLNDLAEAGAALAGGKAA
ncbi:MAG: response regulator [Proteobacteria bacterium]|nr:response regulator [Pseudomonadota bacterium]